MLVLTRKSDETIVLEFGDVRAVVRVCEIDRGKVRLGIVAPAEVRIARMELYEPAAQTALAMS